ncbi:hypothetical protein B296_00058967, partial [Ensete ventricosum]
GGGGARSMRVARLPQWSLLSTPKLDQTATSGQVSRSVLSSEKHGKVCRSLGDVNGQSPIR